MTKQIIKRLLILFIFLGLTAGAAGTLPLEAEIKAASGGQTSYLTGGNPETRVLYTARVSSQAPSNWRELLYKNGIEVGDYLGDSKFLIRLPQKTGLPEIPGLQIKAFETKVSPVLDIRNKGELKEFNITVFQAGDKKVLAAVVKQLGGTITGDLTGTGRVLRVQVPNSAIPIISGLPYVLTVERYRPPQLFNNRASGVVGAAPLQVPGFVLPQGLTGAGQIVAVADTGLDTGKDDASLHPDFKSGTGESKKLIALTTPMGAKTAADPLGHGTHIAGSIAGTGAASGGKYKGLAPGASLYIQSLLDAQNEPELPVDLAQQLFSPAYAAGARIHADSWGGEENKYQSTTAQIDSFIRQKPDFLVLFGAGNNGPDKGSLGPEANSKNALVIGAAENPRPGFGPQSDRVQEIAGFSSRGPTGDGRIKPDLAAPGTEIISTRSSLVEGNFPPNQYYQRKDGTSMATALTAGAAALLREYFIKKGSTPSAALLKASLINGARRIDADPSAGGFGLIDLAGTVLALQEKTMQYTDNTQGIGQGNVTLTKYKVTNPEVPFKVTLTWTDPPASPIASDTLVNNLDLVVVGPNGKSYYGNDWAGKQEADQKNNVEQVYIPNPVPGEYQIKILGNRIIMPGTAGSNSSSPAQDYALVYGQPLLQGTVLSAPATGSSFVLSDYSSVTRKSGSLLKVAVNDRPAAGSPQASLLPGAVVYVAGPRREAGAVYAYYRTIEKPGYTGLANGLLLPVDVQQSEGGYRVAEAWQNDIKINGTAHKKVADILPGSDISGVVNPFTGELWNVSASYKKVSGWISQINFERKIIKLSENSTEYRFDNSTVLHLSSDWEETLPWDVPFIYPQQANLNELAVGMKISLVLSSTGQNIEYIETKQKQVEQIATEINTGTNTVKLENNKEYRLLSGATITRDGHPAVLSSLAPGDQVILTLVAGDTASRLEAHSNLYYGQLVYANTASDSIVFKDQTGQLRVDQLAPGAEIYWQGTRCDLSMLNEGDYVRLAFDPAGEKIWRIDAAALAEAAGRKTLFKEYDPAAKLLTTSDNQKYSVTEKTLITKNGWRIQPEDLFKDEPLQITAVLNPHSGEKILGVVEAAPLPAARSPELTVGEPGQIKTPQFTVSGTAPGARVYLYYEQQQVLAETSPATGDFAVLLPAGSPGLKHINVVAVDLKTGGITGKTWQVNVPGRTIKFTDLAGHWAEKEVYNLAAAGVIHGYPDGSFRPEQPVNREELVRMLIPALDWEPDSGSHLPFSDAGAINPGARPYVAAAVRKGLISGYPDQTFRPGQKLTRAELAAILMRALKEKGQGSDPVTAVVNYADQADIPSWAREAVVLLNSKGIMTGRPQNRFVPQGNVTRAEAAVVMARLRQLLQIP